MTQPTGFTADITARPITITAASGQSKVYGNVDGNLTHIVTSGSLVSVGGVTEQLVGNLVRDAGENVANNYAINQGGLTSAANPNYNITYVGAAYEITKRPITLTATPVTAVYGNADSSLVVTANAGGLGTVNGVVDSIQSVSGELTRSAGANVATYNIQLGVGSASANYDITFNAANAAYSITPRNVTVTASAGQSKTYGSADPVLTISTQAQATNAGLLAADSLVGSLTRAAGEAVGSYAIAQGTYTNANNPNYNIIYVADNFAITKRAITLIADAATKVYGTADPSISVAIGTGSLATISGVQDSLASVTGTLTRSAGENVGSYNILLGSGSSSANYNVTYNAANQAFSITPATLSAVGGKSYDGLQSISGSDLVISGVMGETFSATGLAVMASKNVQSNQALTDASQMVLTGNSGALASNYLPLNVSNTSVSVTPRNISLVAPTVDKVYDGGFTYNLTPADLSVMNSQLYGSDTFSAVKAVFSGNNPNVGTNKVVSIDPTSVSINDGNQGQNYTVSYVNSTGNIAPAILNITAANDAKFSVQSDVVGYAGALYTGFVNGETLANLPLANRTLTVSRSDSTNNAPGTYSLIPSGHGANSAQVGNYQISYVNGTYTILGAKDLLIKASSISNYGSTPVYNFTAQYLDANGTVLSYVGTPGTSPNPINLSSSGSSVFTLNDGSGTFTMGFTPVNAGSSASGKTNTGQYNVTALPGANKTGNSFENWIVVGTSIVNPLAITTPSLSGASISKVYDGSAVVSSQVTNLLSGSAQILSGDAASLSASGFYGDKNVGTSKLVTINFGLNGVDAKNYMLSTNQISGNYGEITQLASVTYVGPVGGDWSVASNWAGGAIPDLSNVASVIIPSGASVIYGAAVAGPVTSQVVANGALNLANAGGPVSLGGISGSGAIALGPNSLTLTSAASGNFSGVISGTGGLTVSGGTQTLSGTNTYSGNTTVDAGASLIIAGSGVLGSGSYAGTVTNNGNFTYASTATQTISGVISGSGDINKENTGTLILTAANTYSGATTIDGGTIAITDAAALGSTAGGTTVNAGGTLDLRGVTGVAEPITINGGTLSTSTGSSRVTSPLVVTGNSTIDVDGTQLTLTNVVSGTGGIDKTGAGTLVLESANTYSGATTIDGGTIAITDAAALGSTAGGTTVNAGGTLDLRGVTGVAEPITLNGGTLAASTGNNSITGPMNLAGNSNSTIDVDGTLLTVTNVISGTGDLTKTGAGTLVLESANTYTGETTIDAGRLTLAAGASIAESERVTVGANGIFDTSAITENVYINSLAGSGSVINGSIAPNALVITDAIPGDVFSGVISGSGGLTIAGGTQTLTGINTYTGPTVVNPGANLIAAIQSIPGDVVNNGSFGFNQSTAGSFTHNMSGSGTMLIGGTGVITLTGTNTQAGGTRIDSGASLMIGSANALSGNQVESNNGSFGITDGIVLSSLGITGTVTLTSDIYTTGAQSYNNVKLAPSAGNLTTLQTVNSDISITGTLDATVGKIQSILINAGAGKVTLGDSIGSIARPNKLTVTGSRIYILADILTGDKQEYNGATSIGDGTFIGKALVKGFLFDSHMQYFEYAKNGVASTIDYYNNDPRYVRTLVSKDPTVTFNGTVDDVSEFKHTLLVAAIAANATTALAPSTMPIINFNDAVSRTIPLYSLNAQTVAAINNTNNPDLSVYVGVININGDITTYSNQTYHSVSISALNGSQATVFSVYDPNASVSFLLPPALSGSLSNPNIVINGQTNLGNWVSNFRQNAALGYKEEISPVLRSVAPAIYRSSGIDGGAIRSALDYHADMTQMSIQITTLSAVTVSSPEETEVLSNKLGTGKSNKAKTSQAEVCSVDANGDTECEDV